MQVVVEATVRVVKPEELKVGDYILWSNLKCKVLQIYLDAVRHKRYVIIGLPDGTSTKIPVYNYFYVIERCEER